MLPVSFLFQMYKVRDSSFGKKIKLTNNSVSVIQLIDQTIFQIKPRFSLADYKGNINECKYFSPKWQSFF